MVRLGSMARGRGLTHEIKDRAKVMILHVQHVEDKRPLCQMSSKRLEDNCHSGLLSSAKHRLSGRRSPDCRRSF